MAKSKSKTEPTAAENASATDSGAFDPVLAALFASSSGPVTAPVKRQASDPRPAKTISTSKEAIATPSDPTRSSEATSSEDEAENAESTSEASESESEPEQSAERPRKRRKVDQNEDLESTYLDKLAREEEQEIKQREKQDRPVKDEDDSDLNSDLADVSDSEDDISITEDEEALPKHESLSQTAHHLEAEKSKRTVFLGNVSTSVIKVKADKKTFIAHLRSGLDIKHHEKIESIRFRSAAFVQDAGPRRAAYATKQLMEETTKSMNAYVVVNTEAAARKLAARLNGSIVLERHLRVDNLGAPARIDHRRCVFVGNLSFVDEDTVNEEVDGEMKNRKRAKEPADVEEGLWRTFEKCGKVESVRVIRDKETRISKGFAYVQFQDENGVEAALPLDGKKFPPLLPRALRVSRAKRDTKKRKDDLFDRKNSDRRLGKPQDRSNGIRKPLRAADGERKIFEGHRASSNSLPKGLKKLKKLEKRPAKKPNNRGSKRAAAFRAGGGKKKRDMEA